MKKLFLGDSEGFENEDLGIKFCKYLYGEDTLWVQTSYNHRFRGRYAGVGYTYYKDADVFAAPKPEAFPSWVLNKNTYEWVPPVSKPSEGLWSWDEENIQWIEVGSVHAPNVQFPNEPRPDEEPGYLWTFTLEDLKWFKVKLPDREPPSRDGLLDNQFWDWDFNKGDWVILTV
jgi:hypothetical protein